MKANLNCEAKDTKQPPGLLKWQRLERLVSKLLSKVVSGILLLRKENRREAMGRFENVLECQAMQSSWRMSKESSFFSLSLVPRYRSHRMQYQQSLKSSMSWKIRSYIYIMLDFDNNQLLLLKHWKIIRINWKQSFLVENSTVRS